MPAPGATTGPTAAPDARQPKPRSSVMAIAPYVPGRSTAAGGRTLYKLSSNETPFGPSPAAVEAFRKAGDKLHVYPDGGATELRKAIAGAYGLNPDRIVCGAGSDQILAWLAQAYLEKGDEAIYSRHGFLIYPIAILAAGGVPVVAAEPNLVADVDAILARVTERTRLVFIANPNNPTGTYLPFDEVRRLHAGLPKNVILVIDAAYAEYVRRNDYESGMELAATEPNVVMTRTFSKIYGLAALRIGWCYGPAAIVDVLHRMREPFNMSTPAIAAGVAAVNDRAHLEHAADHNEVWLQRLSDAVAGLGLTVTPSAANFILVHFPDRPGRSAEDADRHLMAAGIVVRRVEAYGLPNALRITIGSEAANLAVIEALTEFVGDDKTS